jgi:exopolyphosphatase/guanosine-5'-triphosphate,3'-diphosphate pyrophosphatase
MTRKASIDIGTNSTRLLIADMDQAVLIQPVSYQERITKLGNGLDQFGRLSVDSMRRVLDVVQEYIAQCQKSGAQHIAVFATSATRDAANRNEFLTLITERTGLSCVVLSGEEEARLSYIGAVSDLERYRQMLVCDIGGGSTEFVLGEKKGIIFAKSLDIGSRRMTSRFLQNDPVSLRQVEELQSFLNNQMNSQLAELPERASKCICVGGTATTLAMMAAKLNPSQAEKAHHHLLSSGRLDAIIGDLAAMTLQERKSLIGLHPDRADVILAGALIVKSILNRFACSRALISTRDLLFGILME